jgi:LEA14-like dessication related protein
MPARAIASVSITVLAACAFTSCASTETLVSSPTVNLSSVELEKMDFRRQTFLLAFDVSNPNPFPLPVKSLTYQVLFDDQKFAGGEAASSFVVPARGDDQFAISVDIDILNSATQLVSLLDNGAPEQVNYSLRGSFTVDIPFTRPIPFSSSGVIRVRGY